MKNKILHHIFSVAFVVILLLPFAVQSMHSLQGHKHEICNAKEVKHIHKLKTNDCSVFHRNIEQHSIDFGSIFNLEINNFSSKVPTQFHQQKVEVTQKFKSPRAPPYFIV